MRLAVASAKGSPGVTTLVQALATASRQRSLLVAELDDAGGDLASRLGLGVEPGVVSLAAAARRHVTDAFIEDHAQEWAGHRLLVAPPSGSAAAAAARIIAEPLAVAHADVVADCGRLNAEAPALAFGRRADAVLLVLRTGGEDVAHGHGCVEMLHQHGIQPLLVIAGSRTTTRRSYSGSEIAAALRCELIGTVPFDRRAADAFSGARVAPAAMLTRSSLVRAAAGLWRDLGARFNNPTASRPARRVEATAS